MSSFLASRSLLTPFTQTNAVAAAKKAFLLPSGKSVRLGRLPDRAPVRLLNLERYFDSMPPAPESVDYISKVPDWPMLYNDRAGCCAVSSVGHMINAWTTYDAPKAVVITDAEVIAAYSAISGYDPRTGANDNGCDMNDLMKYWLTKGIAGRKILGFAGIDARNWPLVVAAAHVFGGCNLGIWMPFGWQSQTGPNGVWRENQGQHGSWGGHAVPLLKASLSQRVAEVVTWGDRQKITAGALAQYCDICFVAISLDWVNADRVTPAGFHLNDLIEDLQSLGGSVVGPIPEPEPTPGPGPQPPQPTPGPGPQPVKKEYLEAVGTGSFPVKGIFGTNYERVEIKISGTITDQAPVQNEFAQIEPHSVVFNGREVEQPVGFAISYAKFVQIAAAVFDLLQREEVSSVADAISDLIKKGRSGDIEAIISGSANAATALLELIKAIEQVIGKFKVDRDTNVSASLGSFSDWIIKYGPLVIEIVQKILKS